MDILTKALGTTEHPGHVKTKGEYVTHRELFKNHQGVSNFLRSQVILEREKHWENKLKTMEDRFQTQESLSKQKFQELKAFCKGQSTPTTPSQLEVQAT